jgi:hypothetical protein
MAERESDIDFFNILRGHCERAGFDCCLRDGLGELAERKTLFKVR